MTDDIAGKKNGIHLGIVPDGNRRWARNKGLDVWEGHRAGAENLWRILKYCSNNSVISIDSVSAFGLSTENLNRSEEEIEKLWGIYVREFMKRLPEIKRMKIKVNIFGERKMWPSSFKRAAYHVMSETQHFSNNFLNIGMAYSGEREIIQAAQKLGNRAIELFKKYLYVDKPVDLLIRTGNQYRLSNFMPIQVLYAELRFKKQLWPNYTPKELEKDLQWYVKRVRRFGK
jgi:undecaprenyl diphosphate synthase